MAGKTTAFLSNWFGINPPSGLRIGNYTGTGIGLGTGGDQVNLYNGVSSTPVASVLFGTSPTATFGTFDNTAGLNTITTAITQLSAVGVNGAFVAVNSSSEIGSPGVFTKTTSLSTDTFLENITPFNVIAYPNPFNSAFQLDFTTTSNDEVDMKVYDMNGKLVEVRKLDTTESKSLNTGNNYTSGIYNVILTQGQNAKTVRVIKK